jgi:hypothetical protein
MKIMQNIAVSFVKLGQYNDAVTALEHIMVEEPTFRTGLNLILCYFALHDKEKMKRTFDRLLTVELNVDDDHKYSATPVSKCCRYHSYCSLYMLTINLPACFVCTAGVMCYNETLRRVKCY